MTFEFIDSFKKVKYGATYYQVKNKNLRFIEG